MVRRVLVAGGLVVALALSAVTAFGLDNVKPANGGSVASDAAPSEDKGDSVGADACARTNGPGNSEDFEAWGYNELFTIQNRDPRTISVTIGFDSGSPGAYVRFRRVGSSTVTTAKHFTSAEDTQTFSLSCGDWLLQIRSDRTIYNTHGSLTATPQ